MLKYKLRRLKRRHGVLIAAVLTAVIVSSGFAFTNSNTFTNQGGKAGDGQGPVSGYTISNVSYTLVAADPTKIQSWQITFQAGSAPTSVYSRAEDTSGNPVPAGSPWISCSGSGAGPWTCTPGTSPDYRPSTAAVMNVEVSASQ